MDRSEGLVPIISLAMAFFVITGAGLGAKAGSDLTGSEQETTATLELPSGIDALAWVRGMELPQCAGPVSSWNNCYGRTEGSDRTIAEGKFERGFLSDGTLVDPLHDRVLRGYFANNALYGIGEEDASGERFVGHFREGIREGYGSAYLNSGRVMSGMYEHGKASGKFDVRDASGKLLTTQIWKDGTLSNEPQ